MNAYSFLIMFLSVVLSLLTSFCSGKGFAPVRIEGDSYEAQGELIDGKPVTGQGVKVSVKRSKQGRGDTIHRYTVRIQPGDSWEHGTASGRTIWIDGSGSSQFMISLPVQAADVKNTSVLITGKTREQTMKELQAVVTGGLRGYAEEQIKYSVAKLAEKASEFAFGVTTSYIELEYPFEETRSGAMSVLKCDFEGPDASKRFDKIDEIFISFDVVYKKPGKHYVSLIPDIRATGNLVDPSLPLRGSMGGYYLIEYRQELILFYKGDFEGSRKSEEHSYFPLMAGSKWTYRTRVQMVVPGFIENPREEGSTTFTVVGKKTVNNRECIVVSEGLNESYYYNDEGNVMLAGSRGFASIEEFLLKQGLKIVLPAVYLEESLSPGNSWVRERIIGTHPESHVVSQVLGFETVDVPAGRFDDAAKVESRLSVGDMGEVVMIEWLTKGVGRIKGSMRA